MRFLLFSVVSLLCLEIQAADIWVDDDGVQAKLFQIPQAHKTIQKAVSAAAAGDTIKVLPGVYSGAVKITKPLTLQAMSDSQTPVNATLSPQHTDWPVILQAGGQAGIRVQGAQGVTIQGFKIRNGTNGILLSMIGSAGDFRKLCENIYVLGNRIEDMTQEGIQVRQCNRVYVAGNQIQNGKGAGVGFLAVANSVIANNQVGQAKAGITVNGGSIHILVENNEVVGPLEEFAISTGGFVTPECMFYSSREKYQARYLTVRNNKSSYGGLFESCQSCSAVDNAFPTMNVAEERPERSLDLCIASSGRVHFDQIDPLEIIYSGCSTTWPEGVKVEISEGWDVRGGVQKGGLPPAPPAAKSQARRP